LAAISDPVLLAKLFEQALAAETPEQLTDLIDRANGNRPAE